jgi:hypothetical protein
LPERFDRQALEIQQPADEETDGQDPNQRHRPPAARLVEMLALVRLQGLQARSQQPCRAGEQHRVARAGHRRRAL